MSTKYGLPLTTPSKQTILPALSQSGVVLGFYPIAETTFTGTETDYELSDCTVPLKSVTVDANTHLNTTQYMAAVFPFSASVDQPWASADLIEGGDGTYRWYSQPTMTWMLHEGNGILIDGLINGLAQTVPPVVTPEPPVVEPATMEWNATLDYSALTGDCPFFDFNWMTIFAAKSTGNAPMRIVVVSNPEPEAPATIPALKASVIGIPTATSQGAIFDTIRIMKLLEVEAKDYTFEFKVFDITGLSTDVTLTLTVK